MTLWAEQPSKYGWSMEKSPTTSYPCSMASSSSLRAARQDGDRVRMRDRGIHTCCMWEALHSIILRLSRWDFLWKINYLLKYCENIPFFFIYQSINIVHYTNVGISTLLIICVDNDHWCNECVNLQLEKLWKLIFGIHVSLSFFLLSGCTKGKNNYNVDVKVNADLYSIRRCNANSASR